MSKQATLPRGIHHVAFATKDSKTTYDFYHNKLGMPLCHTENHLQGKGHFRHFFFDMGNEQYMAFFEIDNVGESEEYRTDISTGLGMPVWVNHIAFNAENEEKYQELAARVKSAGIPVMGEVDHGWCKSIYFADPNMIMLEFTYTQDEEKFAQTHDEAYDLLFNTPMESVGDDSRKKVTKVE